MSGVLVILRNPPGGDMVELGTQYLHRGGWEVVNKAEEGSGGRSTVTLDDPDMTLWAYLGLNIGGRQQIRLVDVESDRIVAFGFTGKRGIKRRYDDKGQPAGRAWTVDIWDPNAILQRRILTHAGARRPRESDLDRINALLDFPEWGLIDQFMIGPSETMMSRHDYRGMTVGQYIADCGQAARKNHWVDIADIGDGDHLTFWYGRDTRDVYASTLAISNDLADIDHETVFPPSSDGEYTMDPERVFDGIWATGEKSSMYRRRPETSDVFGLRWDTAMQWPTVHEHDRLEAKAESMLERLADEQQIYETAILVPADKAHLVRAGMRIPVKLTHVPALAEFTDCRILSRGVSLRNDGAKYLIPLTLEPIGAEATVACSTSLSGVITVDGSSTAYAGGDMTVSTTPEAGQDSLLFAVAIAANSNVPSDHDMVATGSTTLLHQDNATAGSPCWGSFYRAVTAASGSYSLDGSYTRGCCADADSHWGMAVAAIRTSATAPVQAKTATDPFAATVTFDDPLTPGNILLMVAGDRSGPWPNTHFEDDGWTLIAHAAAVDAPIGGTTEDVGLYARCIQSGDAQGPWGYLYGESGTFVSVSEWEIT